MLETIAMTVQSDVSYDDFVNLIISYCGLNFQSEELVISYMHNSFENQRVLPFKITDQVQLRVYLSDLSKPVLSVYVVKKMRENENQNVEEQQRQDFFDDRLDDLDMNIPDDDQTPTPVDATNTMMIKHLRSLMRPIRCAVLLNQHNLKIFKTTGPAFLLECHSRTRMNYLTLCLFLA